MTDRYVQDGDERRLMTEEEVAVQAATEEAMAVVAAEAAAETTRREQAKALYLALKAGTATSRQVQGVVAWLLRQEIRELEP
jgi:hypothetical protein